MSDSSEVCFLERRCSLSDILDLPPPIEKTTSEQTKSDRVLTSAENLLAIREKEKKKEELAKAKAEKKAAQLLKKQAREEKGR